MRIKVFLLSLSLSTWYQSQGRKPNSFLFPVSSTPRNLLVTVFHSGHLPHLPILSGQSDRRKKTLTAGKIFRRTSGDVFFRHRPYQKERLEEISNFCEGTGTKGASTRRPRAIFRSAAASHVPACEGVRSLFRRRASSSSFA